MERALNKTTAPHPEYILTLSCQDQRGIVQRVSALLLDHHCNILHSAQYGEPLTGRFFMRVHFALEEASVSDSDLRGACVAVGKDLCMSWELRDARAKPRTLIMVSKIGHCLNDLLFRHKSGLLPIEIPAIVSNHPDFEPLAASYGIPFYHMPLPTGSSPELKATQEARVMELMEKERVELVVLARYMQILSPELCKALNGKAINIHHSFLPSFKGARPYEQAHARGVKLIGATAHFVTGDLDEGPIIEQEVARVDHSMSPETLSGIGRDVEAVALARAVKWFAERRILLNGATTVVFK